MKTFAKNMLAIATLIAVIGAMVFGGQARAEYPTKPITLMVGFSAGGGTDVYARALASFVHEHIGMPMVVVNKPGAAGMIAAKAVHNANSDGYTLLVAGGGTFQVKAVIDGEKAPVTPARDFQPLGGIGKLVTALMVPADSPFKSAKELVEYAKANQGKLRWSNPGRGSLHTLGGMLFLKENGVEAQSVPFKGGSKARVAVAGKQVDFAFIGVQLLAGFEDKLRALGVTDNERDKVYKNVPTFGEQGLPQMGVSNPMIIWGKKDLPDDVVAKLKDAIGKVADSDGYQKMIKKTGVTGFYFTADEAAAKMGDLDKTVTPITMEIFHKK